VKYIVANFSFSSPGLNEDKSTEQCRPIRPLVYKSTTHFITWWYYCIIRIIISHLFVFL